MINYISVEMSGTFEDANVNSRIWQSVGNNSSVWCDSPLNQIGYILNQAK